VVFTQIPSPYQVDLFNRVQASEAVHISVIYQARSDKSRLWKTCELLHPHDFLGECSGQKLRKMLAQADLVVFSGYRDHHLRALMSLREASRRPWVFWGEKMGFQVPVWLGALYRRWNLRILHRSSAGMWGIGSWAVKQFAAEFGQNRSYTNVPYSSDLSGFLAIEREAESNRPRRFLFSGSLTRRKGFNLLLEGMEQLLREGVDVQLSVVGAGPFESQALKLKEKYGGRVEIMGFLQPQDLPRAYGECDVLCAPSRYDGWGLVVVEGMAAGMPVISTSATGAAVDLLDDSCGWVIRPSDQISLYNALKSAADIDTSKLRQMGLMGRERARAFDVEEGTQRFVSAALSAMQSPAATVTGPARSFGLGGSDASSRR
jgi:glycosyltransferase involved in cell wall biosynthesis